MLALNVRSYADFLTSTQNVSNYDTDIGPAISTIWVGLIKTAGDIIL